MINLILNCKRLLGDKEEDVDWLFLIHKRV